MNPLETELENDGSSMDADVPRNAQCALGQRVANASAMPVAERPTILFRDVDLSDGLPSLPFLSPPSPSPQADAVEQRVTRDGGGAHAANCELLETPQDFANLGEPWRSAQGTQRCILRMCPPLIHAA